VDHQKKLAFARLEAGVVHRSTHLPSVSQMFDQFGVTGIKGLGCASLNVCTWGDDMERRFIESITKDDSIKSITHVGRDRYQVFTQTANGEDRRSGFRCHNDWDLTRNVPVRFVICWGYSQEDLPKAIPFNDTSVDWIEINGNQVPKSARITNNSILNLDGTSFRFSEEVTVDVHWFSFNDDLSDELFDEKTLHDRTKMDELLDVTVFDKTSIAPDKKR
jgi:hypothetical protein